jgi:hypothetical protein
MSKLTRRSLIRTSFGLVTAGTMARPYLGNAAAKNRDRVVGAGLCP